jgi:hypothetical protein
MRGLIYLRQRSKNNANAIAMHHEYGKKIGLR